MMLIRHAPGQSLSLEQDLDRYYNRHISPGDRREPSYRRVFVIAQPGFDDLLPRIASRFQGSRPSGPAPDFEPVAWLLQVLSLGRTTALADARSQLLALEGENARLRELVDAYERGHFIRFMARLDRWRKTLGR
jgi:hypothetical protein